MFEYSIISVTIGNGKSAIIDGLAAVDSLASLKVVLSGTVERFYV